MIIDDVMTDKITLHGLGFVQVQLQGNQRLHVWHPELPRRACFQHSAIHDHRFNFTSRVIVGTQTNEEFGLVRDDAGDFVLYLHEGARTAGGGRPWTPDGRAFLIPTGADSISAGNDYNTQAYAYHRTRPGGDGRVATIMAKRGEYPAGAHSTCRFGIQPDTDFDRFQWSPAQLWEVVADVLIGQHDRHRLVRLRVLLQGTAVMSWYAESWQRMDSTYRRTKRDGYDPPAISKAIDESYPYSSRSGYAYKAWLAARKNFFRKHNIPLRRAKRPTPDLLS